MARFKVVLIEHGYASSEHERRIIAAAGGEFIDAEKRPLEEALKLCEEADGILFRRLTITRELIRRFRRCKIILRYGVGTDNVDSAAATEAGIIVGHVPGYCIEEVSTQAVALLLACVRQVVTNHKKIEAGGFDVNRYDAIHRVAGRTLGLVGLGNIGQSVARKLGSGWGLRILATDPYVEPAKAKAAGAELVDLETLLRESEYVSLHAPLLPETKHLINERTLALMKPGAILVNTARGGVVDGGALLKALDAGRLAAAGLDVFEEEPLPADSPFRRHPRTVVTDHMAWYSVESQVELQTIAAQEIARVCSGGLPASLMNPEVLKKLGRFNEWQPSDVVRWQLKRMEALSPSL
ncbi:MAG: C-terminal binding protein [Verrucomicrobiota bacterium]